MLKENKGVTLVALVITIIVLLILAGVSIAMVAGDNGVLNQAVNASVKTIGATAKQDVETALTSVQTDFMAQKFENNLTAKFYGYINADPGGVDGSILQYLDEKDYGIVAGTFVKTAPSATSSGTLKFDVSYKGTTFHVECTFTKSGAGLKLDKFYSGSEANEDYMEY